VQDFPAGQLRYEHRDAETGEVLQSIEFALGDAAALGVEAGKTSFFSYVYGVAAHLMSLPVVAAAVASSQRGIFINNHTTNHNNQKFNLNFFLNDTCKDAISITDFLRNLNVHIDELEYIGNHGYVNGMTKMIMDRLKDMDITKRPIHCTDIKRETMYIKDDAGWSKDTDELTKLRRILSRISMNNYRTVPVWRTAHPDCEVMETRTYEFCYKMMKEILGDVEEEQIKLDNKIIKTMAKELFVQKQIN
jgi:hypothetical protein